MNESLLQTDGTGTLADRVYAHVIEAILRGDFSPSGKLPTEGELVRHFGVSRPTVREALSRLRADGLIDSRRGSGSYLIEPPGAAAGSSTPVKSLADIEYYYVYRACVEAGAAAGAAEYRDAADLEEIHAAFDALGAIMETGASGVEADMRFHLAIARASHNPFFVDAVQNSVAPIRQFIELARHLTDKKSRERMRTTQSEHQAIVSAIERRSPADAADAIRVHVQNSKRRIFESTTLR
jgi:GntR family transcriptional repressor for pyruvate dehydrogenase complex